MKKCKEGFIWYAGACRSIKSVEERREKDRLRSKKKYKDKEWAKNKNAEKRKKYRKDIELNRAKSREYYHKNKEVENEKRQLWREENRERELASRRKHYKANRKEMARREREKRDRREPSRIINRAIGKLKKGDIKLDEFIEIISKAIKRSDELHDKFRRETEGKRGHNHYSTAQNRLNGKCGECIIQDSANPSEHGEAGHGDDEK